MQKFIEFRGNKICCQATGFSSVTSSPTCSTRPDRTHVLANVNMPVLFIIGKNDSRIPLQAILPQTILPRHVVFECMGIRTSFLQGISVFFNYGGDVGFSSGRTKKNCFILHFEPR